MNDRQCCVSRTLQKFFSPCLLMSHPLTHVVLHTASVRPPPIIQPAACSEAMMMAPNVSTHLFDVSNTLFLASSGAESWRRGMECTSLRIMAFSVLKTATVAALTGSPANPLPFLALFLEDLHEGRFFAALEKRLLRWSTLCPSTPPSPVSRAVAKLDAEGSS